MKMADFSFPSDTDDSAVEELISQTQDLCVLEQVSAINCSGFVDSVLPNDLESRFSRLKSFPARNPKPRPSVPPHAASARYQSEVTSKTELDNSVRGKDESDEDASIFSPSKQNPERKMAPNSKSPSGYLSSPLGSSESSLKKLGISPTKQSKGGSVSFSSNSSNSSPEGGKFSISKRNLEEKKCRRSKLQSGSFSFPLGSSNSTRDSPSPPKRAGCFWCSPKKDSRRRSKEDWSISSDFDWRKNDELLSDLGSFSFKEQRKILKMAMKEQQKISREAHKIVKLAKQASAKMNVSGIEDELSDS
ncbi:vitellogenin-2 protein [Parasponia andersonii]|uniref:Vitellogenin-2 protein n=1 Tax=Parasponia andersonii TaxID=3476 RepID=A0A2P5BFI8_PARAD|nr:vitellogenin-2 protein [Parasponia andersonii]